ncbi:MAG: hypothetical protein WCX73_01090 [Candidatus Pacearchaeota archaeon]|jgi:hypothetical protein
MIESLQSISIAIELIIAILGLSILFKKKKIYGLGIFITFVIYVFYDYAKLNSININTNLLSFLFFIASLSMFLVVIKLWKEKSKK